jgi:glycosyltransferase involved in cell wall biosynthesis
MTGTRPEIHFVHSSSGTGGLEVLLPGITRRLSGYRFSAFVIRPRRTAGNDVYKNTNMAITYGSFNDPAAYSKLFKYAFRNRTAVFHLFSPGPIALLTVRLAGVRKLVYSIHGTRYWENGWQKFILNILWRLAIRKEYIFTANSAFSAEVFRKNIINLRNIRVIYNPIDSDIFINPDQRHYPAIPGKIIYCGRLSCGKNMTQWIDVAIYLRKQFPDMVFEIYGEGPEEAALRKKITDQDLGNFISLRGFTDKLQEVYQQADLLLFLSNYESFGNVVVESIMCGTPVLAYDIPSMKEIFRDFPQFLVPAEGKPEENISDKMRNYGPLRDLTGKVRDSFIRRFDPLSHDTALKEIYDTFHAKQA